MENSIILRKKRDFGEVLNTTFLFIKQEFKPLLIKLLIYFGPLGLVSGLAMANYLNDLTNIMKWAKDDPNTFFNIFLKSYSIILLGIWLSYSMLTSVVVTYMQLYHEKGKNGFTNEEFGQSVFQNFLKVLIYSIPLGILVVIGVVACIIPGIYLSISLSLFFPILFFEKKSFGDAFNRSFSLSHQAWWWTFLLIIVCSIITGVLGMVFSIPNMILTWLSMLHSAQGQEVTSSLKASSTIIAVLTTFFSNLLYTIPLIGITLQYFSIREQKENLTSVDNSGNELNA